MFKGAKSMKKWISLLLIGVFFLILSASDIFRSARERRESIEKPRMLLIQDTEKEGKGDTYSIALLKQMKEKVDGWLKSLNEKIEEEDITRLEVRFYEFLRNILEWVKEKIDAKIDSSEKEKSKGGGKEGIIRQTRQRVFSIFEIG
jgi:hypothetical protein